MIRSLWSPTLLRLWLSGSILWAAPGCFRYHVYQVGGTAGIEGGNQPATEWESRTRHSFFWGLIRQDVPTENCTLGDGTRTGIEEVRVDTNLGFAALTVLTLGIWSPLKVSWKCAKPPAPRGPIDRGEP